MIDAKHPALQVRRTGVIDEACDVAEVASVDMRPQLRLLGRQEGRVQLVQNAGWEVLTHTE